MIGVIGATRIVPIVDTYMGVLRTSVVKLGRRKTMSHRSQRPGNHEPPTPSRSVQRLEALVGRWRTEGHIVGEPPIPVRGTDIYEWLPGGFFLVHHVDVLIQDQPVQAIEIIGELDQATGSIIGRAYDNRGEIRSCMPRSMHKGCGHSRAGQTSRRLRSPPRPMRGGPCGRP